MSINLLVEKVPDTLVVGDFCLKFKTDFSLWVKFLIDIEKKNDEETNKNLLNIFGELPTNINYVQLIDSIMNWLSLNAPKNNSGVSVEKTTTGRAFDFEIDGNVLYCEMWEHFPHMMKQGISYHEGMEIISLLLNNENTVIHHRAFARVGDFSKMSKDQQRFWQKERVKYAIKKKQQNKELDFANAF